MKLSLLPLMLIFNLISLLALADESDATLNTRSQNHNSKLMSPALKRPRNRRLASLESPEAISRARVSRTKMNKKKAESFNWKLAVSGGTSSTKSSDQVTGDSSNASSAKSSTSLGISSESALWTYLGLGAEFIYLLPINTSTTYSTVTSKEISFMADTSFRYPLALAGVKFIPRIGLGYGYMTSETMEIITGMNEDSGHTTKMGGVYWTIGLEILPIKDLTIAADFSSSLKAVGGIIHPGIDYTTSYKYDVASFNRVRLGVYYKIFSGFSLGAQYLSKTMNSAIEYKDIIGLANSLSLTTKSLQSQIRGVLVYDLW